MVPARGFEPWLITNQMLYQLSYAGPVVLLWDHNAATRGGSR